MGSCYAFQGGLEFSKQPRLALHSAILLLHRPKCWGYRRALPHLATHKYRYSYKVTVHHWLDIPRLDVIVIGGNHLALFLTLLMLTILADPMKDIRTTIVLFLILTFKNLPNPDSRANLDHSN